MHLQIPVTPYRLRANFQSKTGGSVRAPRPGRGGQALPGLLLLPGARCG